MLRVAIVGSGLIGRSWAVVFARAGYDVALYDPIDTVAAKAGELIADDLRSWKHGAWMPPQPTRRSGLPPR